MIESHEPYRVRETLRQAEADESSPLPVLADAAQTVAATYGVAFQMDDTIEWSNRPAAFLIDRDGVVRYAHRAEASYNDRPTLDDLLREQDRMHKAE